jgi:hypothetical protein
MFELWQDQIDRELRRLRRVEAREGQTLEDQLLRAPRPGAGWGGRGTWAYLASGVRGIGHAYAAMRRQVGPAAARAGLRG